MPTWCSRSGARTSGVRGEAFNFSPETRVSVLDITRMIQRADAAARI